MVRTSPRPALAAVALAAFLFAGTSAFAAMESYTATLNGAATPVTWSIQEGATGGTIDQNGNYTAPALPGTFHVVATSQINSSNFAVSTVTVLAGGADVTVQTRKRGGKK